MHFEPWGSRHKRDGPFTPRNDHIVPPGVRFRAFFGQGKARPLGRSGHAAADRQHREGDHNKSNPSRRTHLVSAGLSPTQALVSGSANYPYRPCDPWFPSSYSRDSRYSWFLFVNAAPPAAARRRLRWSCSRSGSCGGCILRIRRGICGSRFSSAKRRRRPGRRSSIRG